MTIVWDKKTISCLGDVVQKHGEMATFSPSGVSEEVWSELHESSQYYTYSLDCNIDFEFHPHIIQTDRQICTTICRRLGGITTKLGWRDCDCRTGRCVDRGQLTDNSINTCPKTRKHSTLSSVSVVERNEGRVAVWCLFSSILVLHLITCFAWNWFLNLYVQNSIHHTFNPIF